MNKHGMRIAACALAGTFALSGYQMTLEAHINRSANIPAAGIAVVLDEGSTIQDLQVEVVQNIAYLESVSGIQPNILNASKKSALAGTAANSVLAQAPADDTTSASTQTVHTVEADNSADATEENQDNGEGSEQSQAVQDGNNENNANEDNSNESDLTESQQSNKEESDVIGSDGSETNNTEISQSETDASEKTEEYNEKESDANQEGTKEPASESDISEENTSEDDSLETSTETFKDGVLGEAIKTSVGFSATELYEVPESEEETTEEETEETKEDEQDFSGLVIARVNNYVNVRSMPSEEGEIVGKLYDKSVGEFIEEQDGWYKIKSGNCTGFVKGEFCVVGEEAEKLAKEVGTTYAIVNTTTLKVRKEASTESAVLGLVPIGEELVVVEELDGWVKIAIEEGDGYVSRDYVNLRTDFVCAESREEEEARLAKEAQEREEARAAAAAAEATRAKEKAQKASNNEAVIEAAQNTAAASQGSEIGKAVIDYATQFVGNPYVYGGSSLTNGTDCSGFVMSVYANFGVSLPHSSSAIRSRGYDVGGLANAQPGDIVCYSGHVGLYVGNGQIVHASTSKTGIIVSSATYRNILSVRRIF